MTVTYSQYVISCKRTGNFIRLLFKWKGSMYKLVWPDMIVYFTVYFIINFYYRLVLTESIDRDDDRRYYESLVKYCRRYANAIPLSFILGFYVSIVINRWWQEFMTFPWPDAMAYHIVTIIRGSDERSRLFRRSIMRYINLSFVLTMGMVCPQVKLRFPTLEHFIKAGILLPHEKIILETLNLRSKHPKYWVPLLWAANISARARREFRIHDDISMNLLITELGAYRSKLGDLLGFDWVNIPLVYSQAVTVATYLYFVANLLGRQFLKDQEEDDSVDIYVPIFQVFEFLFYMGWLRVAETLINPFGNDDDDYEVNYIIDRNFQTSYVIVDEMYNDHPVLLKDMYWDCFAPDRLPYTRAANLYKEKMFVGTAMGRTQSTRYIEERYISKSLRKKKPGNTDDKMLTEHQKRKIARKIKYQDELRKARDEREQELKVEPEAGTSSKSKEQDAEHGINPKLDGHGARKTDLFNKIALVYKLVAERKRLDSLNDGGYWNSITGPVLADISLFYEPETLVKYVRPAVVPVEAVQVVLEDKRSRPDTSS